MSVPLLDIAPERRRVLADAASWRFAAPSLTADEAARQERRGPWRKHAHGHRELMLTLSGDMPYGVGDHVYRCQPGTWLVMEAFQPHDDGYGEAPPNLEHLWISLVDDRAFARVYTVERGRHSTSPNLVVGPEAAGEARRALDDARALRADAPALARARVAGACAALAVRLLAPADDGPPRNAQSEAIDAILRHIAYCSGSGVSIEHLARIAGYSPFHFARIFRQRTGRTVHQYVDECRRRAYADLRAERIAHRDIAERLGFSCASAFSRWLRGQKRIGKLG